jgi:hypothetical protein
MNTSTFTSTFADEEWLIAQAVDALVERLGPLEAIRFLAMPRKKRMESVERHRQWQSSLDKDAFFAKVFESRKPEVEEPD